MHQPDTVQLESEISEPTGGSVDDCDDDNCEIPIDQAYLSHIEEQQDFETMEKMKRVWSKGVWYISSMTHLALMLTSQNEAFRNWEAQVDLFAWEIIGHDAQWKPAPE